jgi:hypothetical protein
MPESALIQHKVEAEFVRITNLAVVNAIRNWLVTYPHGK